jgi:hypothetical protein
MFIRLAPKGSEKTMKSKTKDRIRLPDGRIMTLGEALDAGLIELIQSTYYDPPRYFARADDVSWEIGKTLYLSRTGGNLPFGR